MAFIYIILYIVAEVRGRDGVYICIYIYIYWMEQKGESGFFYKTEVSILRGGAGREGGKGFFYNNDNNKKDLSR